MPFLIFLAKLLSWVWRKIATNTTYRVPLGYDLLGIPATVKISVSSNGGTISIQHSDTTQQFGAKSLHPLSWFYPGDVVYICDYEDGIYYVDDIAENVNVKAAKKFQKLSSKKFSYIFSKSVNADR